MNASLHLLRVELGVRSAALSGARLLGRRASSSTTRLHTADPRMSGVVIRGRTVYLSGQVPEPPFRAPIREQVEQTLAKVDRLLADAGTHKGEVLTAHLWLKDIERDFAPMNDVWNAWVDPENKPARACVEAKLANDDILFEVMVVAALPEDAGTVVT